MGDLGEEGGGGGVSLLHGLVRGIIVINVVIDASYYCWG